MTAQDTLWNGLRNGDPLTVVIGSAAYRATYRRPHPKAPSDTFLFTFIGDDGRVHYGSAFMRDENIVWCRGRNPADVNAMLAALALEAGFVAQDEDARK